MADYKFYAFYVASKVGKAGLTVTVDVYKSSDDSKVADNQAANEVAGGLYSYTYTSATADDYMAVFKTTDATVDQQQIPALVIKQVPEISDILADTGTDGVVLKAAGLNADAVAEIQSGLALEATLTAIKGAGWTNETLAAIKVLIDTIKAKTDALDNSTVTFVTAVSGTTITILRGDTFSGSITDIGALTDYVSIDFTVKEAYSKTDDEATIRIRKNASGVSDGLLRLNGAAALSSALGSIAIDDLATGDITITLDETATDDLSTGTYVYDIQMISASGVKTLTYGKLIVTADVTRLVA